MDPKERFLGTELVLSCYWLTDFPSVLPKLPSSRPPSRTLGYEFWVSQSPWHQAQTGLLLHTPDSQRPVPSQQQHRRGHSLITLSYWAPRVSSVFLNWIWQMKYHRGNIWLRKFHSIGSPNYSCNQTHACSKNLTGENSTCKPCIRE